MSKESKTPCVDCITDDLMVVRPVSAVSFAMRVLVFLCPGIAAYILHGYGPYSSSLAGPWLVFVPAAIVTAVMFVATDIRRCVMGNLIGTKVFISLDETGRVHVHRGERNLNYGGGPCVLHTPAGEITLAQRDFKGATLEIGTGWLRRCRIHECPGCGSVVGDWTRSKMMRNGMLEVTDRWGHSFRLQVFGSEVGNRWHDMVDPYIRTVLPVLNGRRGVEDALRHSADRDKSQAEVAGKIG